MRRPLGTAVLLVLAATSLAAAQAPDPEAIGSLRNARVALAMKPGQPRAKLVYLAADMSPEEKAELKKLAPNVLVVSGLDEKSALGHSEAHGVDARLLTPELMKRCKSLVWAHSPGAGVDWLLPMPGLVENDRIVVTNARAVHAPAIADHTMGMLLALTRNLPYYAEAQKTGRWLRDQPPPRPSLALQGKTLLVVGLGGIGTEIATRAHAFGMRIIATRRSGTPSPDWVAKVGKPEDLLAYLAEADVVAIAVPLTAETERLFDDKAFAALKPGAFLLNISRGKVVDTAALLAALKGGRLAGAALDVTDPEPLPPDHPLWKQPNVIITPHVSSDAELTRERAAALFHENLRRFGAGEPLLNVVDKRAGY